MLPHHQPRPLPDKPSKHYGDMWYGVERTWLESEFPVIAKFFDDKFHNGKYRNKNRWVHRNYSLHFTQDTINGPGITRIYVVCCVRPYWFYSAEVARPKSSTLATILRAMLLDEWR